MKILFSVASIAALAAATLGGAGAVSAHGSANSTCAGLLGPDVHVHGDHVLRDYVRAVPPVPGGPGAHGHLPADIAPGASFCNSQSNSPGFHIP